MPSPFHAYRDMAMSAVDAVMAEEVGLAFLRNGVSDPGRTNTTTKMVLRIGAEDADRLGSGSGASWSTRIAAGEARAYLDPATYDGSHLQKGDKIRALERAAKPWFEVAYVNDHGHGRLVYHLRQA